MSAGIGGGFPGTAPPGSIVVADAIVAADLGARTPDGFLPVDRLGFGRSVHPPPPDTARRTAETLAKAGLTVALAPVLTVSTVTGDEARAAELAARHPGAGAEAMEGFGVAEAAAVHGLPVLEIRTVSNPVGPRDRAAWRIPEALAALTDTFAVLTRPGAATAFNALAAGTAETADTADTADRSAAAGKEQPMNGTEPTARTSRDARTDSAAEAAETAPGARPATAAAAPAAATSPAAGASGPGAAGGRPLRIAYSPCPNDTFVFHAWSHGLVPGAPAVDVTFADIDITNGLAERAAAGSREAARRESADTGTGTGSSTGTGTGTGTVSDPRLGPLLDHDILKVSYAVLPWILDAYTLLPCGGALGRGCGPLVLTAAPGRADGLRGKRVAVPSERSTAYLLFRLWAAAEVPGGVGEIVVLPFHEIMPAVRDGAVDAGLVIHEARFTYRDYGLHCLADMGEHWENTTGLPIPLGAIVAKRSLGDRRLRELADAVRTSVRMAWDDPEASRPYVLEHAQEMDPAVADQHIGLYVNEFTADLGEAGYAAVRGLLTRAAAEGLVPPLGPHALAFPGV